MQETGLLRCPECNDTKRYTPVGLNAHLVKVHGKNICPRCGADFDVHREVFNRSHNCQGAEGKL